MFIILVIFRYRRQNLVQLNPDEVVPVENEKPEEETLPQEEETQQPQEEQALAMVVAETQGSKKLWVFVTLYRVKTPFNRDAIFNL